MRFLKYPLFVSFLILAACNNATKTVSVNADTIVQTDPQQATAINSVYLSEEPWINQDGQKTRLKDLTGKVQVVAMIFTSCGYACPKMVENMRAIELALPAPLLKKVHFTLVTFDTDNDTAAALKLYARQKHLDSNWTLLHGTEDQVRMLSMLLDVQYSKLPLGGFNHSNQMTILNQQGEIIKKIQGLDIDPQRSLQVINSILNKK